MIVTLLIMATFTSLVPPSGPRSVAPLFEHLSFPGSADRFRVNVIHQDEAGFFWMGTDHGLEKYDGYRLTSYRHEPFDPLSLSSGRVTHLTEQGDKLWVVAGNILNRLDRSEGTFTRFTPLRAVQGAFWGSPTVMLAAQNGDLWVGTRADGLFRLDVDTNRFVHYIPDPERENSISSNQISALHQDREGRIWIGTPGGGLNRYLPESDGFRSFLDAPAGLFGVGLEIGGHNIPENNQNPSIMEDDYGILWLATYGGGLIEFDPRDESYTQYLHEESDPYSLSHNIILSAYRDARGLFWLATADGGIDVFYPNSSVFRQYRHDDEDPDSIFSDRLLTPVFTEDAVGDIWIGTREGLIQYRRNLDSFHFYDGSESGLSDPHVTCMLLDQAETLWLGTRFGGVNKFSRYKRKFTSFIAQNPQLGASLEDSLIDSLLNSGDGSLWIGTRGRGLFRFDCRSGSVTQYQPEDGPLGRRISSLVTDGTSLWVGSRDQGISRLILDSDTWRHYHRAMLRGRDLNSNEVYTLHLSEDGNVWAGTALGGLHHYNPETDRFEPGSLPHIDSQSDRAAITGILTETDGHFWIARLGVGLHRLDRGGREIIDYRPNIQRTDSLSHPSISRLLKDRSGRLWAATLGGGLNRMMPDQSFRHFTRQSHGLPDNEIYDLSEDRQGNLWMAMPNGLCVLDPERELIRAYGHDVGLVRVPGALAHTEEGQFFLGGRGDLNFFHPRELAHNPYPPPVAVTAVGAFGDVRAHEFHEGEVIHLPWSENRISLAFTALDFTDPLKNSYAYKLEGEDEDWVDSRGARIANYTNLTHGHYTFRVKAANNDGIWNTQGFSLQVEVERPYWKRWWFYLLEACVGVLVVFLVLVVQRRRMQRQKQEALLELELDRKTQELEYARRVQLSMLPESRLTMGQVEMVGMMRTATEVGGDYYDYYRLDEHRWCFLLGDATGHGFAAGLVVGMTKMGSAVWALGQQGSLEEMLLELNEALRRSLKERTMGMALSVGILDTRNHTVELASAGMPFPYHYRATERKLVPLVMKSMPLGFMRKLPVKTHSLTLDRGDYLVLTSDGFIERFDRRNQLWGSDALEARLDHICGEGHGAHVVCEELFRACDAHAAGRSNEDDMTALVLRARAEPS